MKQILFVLILGLGLTSCSTQLAGLESNSSKTAQVESSMKILSLKKFTQFSEGNTQLVDVRTNEEYEESHIENAINIDVEGEDFDEKIQGLDKNKAVFLYCKSGKRSHMAAERLEELGFKYIYELKGGFEAWQKSN